MNLSVNARDLQRSNGTAVDFTGGQGAANTERARFAGLLGAQLDRGAQGNSTGSAGSSAYNGSAFDVPAARREPPPKPADPAERSKLADPRASLIPVRQAVAPAATPAPPARTQPVPPAKPTAAADGKKPAQATSTDKPNAADDDAAKPAEAAKDTDAVATPVGAAVPTAVSPAMDWMARWAAGGAAGAAGAGEGDLASGQPAGAAARTDATQSASGAVPGSKDDPAAALAAASAGTAAANALPFEAVRAADAAPRDAAGHDTATSRLTALEPTAGATHASAALPPPTATALANGGVNVALATPLGAPDFSQALAAQLTTLASNGSHEATLQLNPADMGPIGVQIVLDGTATRIDFTAAQAATRTALQDSFPALAAALHDAGLTLTGGGVSERRQSGGDGTDNTDGSRDGSGRRMGGVGGLAAGDEGGNGGHARGGPISVGGPRGLLDLYA